MRENLAWGIDCLEFLGGDDVFLPVFDLEGEDYWCCSSILVKIVIPFKLDMD